MPIYSIFVVGESNLTITNGETLDGVTQGDGSHLLGEFITIDDRDFEEVVINDTGPESNFADNDSTQRLQQSQTIDDITYSNNTVVEAEYQLTVIDDNTGIEYTLIAVNFVDSSPPFATVEALAFVDTVPPEGVALRVIGTAEGPSNAGGGAIEENRIVPICFVRGTAIRTPRGELNVEDLVPGTPVTRTDGTQAIVRKVMCTRLSEHDLKRSPKQKPIQISAGALGQGLPLRDLFVSPQHRMQVSSRIVQRLFGVDDVLIPAIKLTLLPGIFVVETRATVDYYHVLFDRHEVIFAEGAPSESLFTGPETLKALPDEARDELLSLFPELELPNHTPEPALRIPQNKAQRRLVERHFKNQRPVLETFRSPQVTEIS